ncbi:V-type ATP synthase subunit E [Lachnospiraceae bacterium 62-35]
MTTEDKLQHFLDFCMRDVRTRSSKMLDDYEAALKQNFEEHKAEAESRAKEQIRIQRETIRREVNKQLSMKQLDIKRTLSEKQNELEDMLFVELKDELAKFMDSPAYHLLLDRQIEAAREFAGDSEMVIYMDPADEDMISLLSHNHKVAIRVSDHSFLGGTQVIIPSKNILIDNSFSRKLEEARQNFTFHLDYNAIKDEKGGKDHGE